MMVTAPPLFAMPRAAITSWFAYLGLSAFSFTDEVVSFIALEVSSNEKVSSLVRCERFSI